MATPVATDEKELLQRLQVGDEQAFERIYQKNSARIFGNLLRLVKDSVAAEDLLQDVFVKVSQRRAKINPERSFRSYLFTISRNLAYNYLRNTSLKVQVAAYTI